MEARVAELLPLKPVWLHVLLALADGPMHGYGIMVDVLERTEGKVRLWPATLYNTLKQLLDDDLLAGVDDPGGDGRRRTYRLTELGLAVLDAEAARLEGIVELVRARRGARPSEGTG